MFNITALPWSPYVTKVQLKPWKKEEYEFDGLFKDILTELQVHIPPNHLQGVPQYYCGDGSKITPSSGSKIFSSISARIWQF